MIGIRRLGASLSLQTRGVSLKLGAQCVRDASHVAVVGTGPSGFYTAKYLIKEDPDLRVDLIDALPTPYG